MAIPPNLKSVLEASSHRVNVDLRRMSRANILTSNNIVRASAAKQLDEMQPAAARSAAKILATPIKPK